MIIPPHLILILTPLLFLLSLPQAQAQTDLALFSILLPNASTVALANTQYSVLWTQPLTVVESEPLKVFFQLKDYRNDEPHDPLPLKPLDTTRRARTKAEAHLYPLKVDESKADLRGVVGGRYSVWMVRLGDRKVLARSEEFVIKAQYGLKSTIISTTVLPTPTTVILPTIIAPPPQRVTPNKMILALSISIPLVVVILLASLCCFIKWRRSPAQREKRKQEKQAKLRQKLGLPPVHTDAGPVMTEARRDVEMGLDEPPAYDNIGGMRVEPVVPRAPVIPWKVKRNEKPVDVNTAENSKGGQAVEPQVVTKKPRFEEMYDDGTPESSGTGSSSDAALGSVVNIHMPVDPTDPAALKNMQKEIEKQRRIVEKETKALQKEKERMRKDEEGLVKVREKAKKDIQKARKDTRKAKKKQAEADRNLEAGTAALQEARDWGML